MKSKDIKLSILVISLGLILFLVELQLKKIDLPLDLVNELSLCEITKDSQKFDDKLVRLKVKLNFGLEGSWITDNKCADDSSTAIVNYESQKVLLDIHNLREQKSEKGLLPFEMAVEIEGKFKNKPYKDCCLIAPFQFEISKLEKTE